MNRTEFIQEIKNYTVWQLASMNECGSPDTLTSPGAAWIDGVRDDIVTWLEEHPDSGTSDLAEEAYSIADNAVYTLESRGTHRKWLTYVDLCAYQEDIVADFGPITDIQEGADRALRGIAERLVHVLACGLDDANED